jgi:hypothetical protein
VTTFTDYYAILEVEPSASDDEIKKSYRRLARSFHPDKKPERDDARMKAINEAYAILGDTTKRKEYEKGYSAQRAAQEHADRIRKAKESRKRNSAEAKAYGDRVRANARRYKGAGAQGFTGAGPPPGQTPRTTPPRYYPPARPPSVPPPTKPSTPAGRPIIYKLVMKLGVLVGALAFGAAPLGIMYLWAPVFNQNQHNLAVAFVGLALGLLCIVWCLAGIATIFAAIGNLFSGWPD